ncbi:uncharacterized protein CC84DRAFT_1170272 [Paraphaeosphaeria sporulosa]|uniref:Uncharacterized protein n=1 Tax=Paraphaeosphaeria sporulosa TaxID=1460663 RepID=A0A177CVU2_9PLEO|nr:uncharacterized protein CC84DRAFT_1170272 [Paraphaeosphaeria sporulosa]OAG11356.1 hypothetical protein CC84DRAFT_1170272 [Paraphaeosphaeria sporulosa]
MSSTTQATTTNEFPADRLPAVKHCIEYLLRNCRSDIIFDHKPVDEHDDPDEPDARKWKDFAEHQATAPETGDDVTVKLYARLKKHDKQAPFRLDIGRSQANNYKLFNGTWSASEDIRSLGCYGDRAPELRERREYAVQIKIDVVFVDKSKLFMYWGRELSQQTITTSHPNKPTLSFTRDVQPNALPRHHFTRLRYSTQGGKAALCGGGVGVHITSGTRNGTIESNRATRMEGQMRERERDGRRGITKHKFIE